VVVDSRTHEWFEGGTIPGAVSIPYTYIVDELGELGCEPDFDGFANVFASLHDAGWAML
jgi:3-mercaptopyruvate sulfurtransferase SseA